MTAVFYDIYLFSISTLFKILEWATSSYVGSVLKKTCQKLATVDKGLVVSCWQGREDMLGRIGLLLVVPGDDDDEDRTKNEEAKGGGGEEE